MEGFTRNALIFNSWWVGTSTSQLAKVFSLTDRHVNKLIKDEAKIRGLPHIDIIKKVRREVGPVTAPPLDRNDLRDIVLKAHDLELETNNE